MSDIFTLGTVSDVATWSDGTSKDTGDLRRRYNFGDRVSELATHKTLSLDSYQK